MLISEHPEANFDAVCPSATKAPLWRHERRSDKAKSVEGAELISISEHPETDFNAV